MDQQRTGTSISTYRLGRGALLRASLLGGAGVAAAALLGCGGEDDEPSAQAGASVVTNTGDATGPGELVQDPDLPYPYNFPEPATEPKPGGTMVVSATWDVQNVDPTVSASGGTVTVPNMVYNRLIGIDRGPDADVFNGPVLEPELATSWERSPDGMTFTFKIDPRAKWQNLPPLSGRKFVAADAAFAMNRYKTEGVHQSYYVNVDSITAVDEGTVKVTMTKPVADFLNPLGSNKQTIHPKELVDSGEITKQAIGTGPMIMTEMTPASRVAFTKNPDYWETKVLLDGFDFRIQPDHSARLAAFRAGQVDYAYSVADTLTDVESLLGTNPDIQINVLPVVISTALAMNLANPKFQDERIRRALSLGIDRQAIIQIVYEGLGKTVGTIPWTFLFEQAPDLASQSPWCKYDPQQAKQLLEAAGVTDLTVDNTYFAYTEANNRQTEILVAQFRDIGVTMTGGKADYTEFNSQWIGRKLPEISTVGWATSGFDADNWFYGQIHSQSPGNRWNIGDPQIDQWAEEQQVELDPEARKEIWRKIWDRELDQAYRPAMVGGVTFQIYQPWMRGIRFTGTSPGDNSHFYDWGDEVQHGWLDK
jgi:peptide/nickel transport system substrate-binding protein